jgi:hypothetical protein
MFFMRICAITCFSAGLTFGADPSVANIKLAVRAVNEK